MGNYIELVERDIKAKGARKGSFPDAEKIRSYCFAEEYERLDLLRAVAPFSHLRAHLLYPGCGADILFPLLYVERLFPSLKELQGTFVDQYDNGGLIKTILDEMGIPFSEDGNALHFFWGDLSVYLQLVVGNIFDMNLPSFDIYFERSFRIMKDGHPEYERKIIGKLKEHGVLISDSGFQHTSLRMISVPRELSVYGEMVMGVKGEKGGRSKQN